MAAGSIFVDIWHGILSIPYLVADFLVDAFNLVIVGIAWLASLVLGLLPGFPPPPDPPSGGILGFLTWIAPVGALLSVFAAILSAYVVFLAVRVALRWVKAL